MNKVTETIDAEKLVNDLNKIFDALEAELKQSPPVVSAKANGDDDPAMEDDWNVISSCKKHLIQLLSEYGYVFTTLCIQTLFLQKRHQMMWANDGLVTDCPGLPSLSIL